MILFPSIALFRIIGRLAMPIFAFFIAEGCKYTRNKQKYVLFMAILGVSMMIIQYATIGIYFGNIFILFSLSIILIYSFQKYKSTIFAPSFNINQNFTYGIAFLFTLLFCALSCNIWAVDYGFCGVMLAFFVSIPDFKGIDAGYLTRYDNLSSRLFFLAIAMLILSISIGGNQIASLIALIPLALYNGQRGERNLKYFFYIFYPAHLIVLYTIAFFI